MKLTIRPLTPDLWPALEDLFGENGACYGCWCMYWRIGSQYRKRPREKNKAAFREVVKRRPPPGLLAFNGDRAVGWCQLNASLRLAVAGSGVAAQARGRSAGLVALLLLCAEGLSQARRHVGANRCGVESRQARQGARARSLSSRCGRDAERFRHRLCLNFRARRIQDRCAARAASPDHAPRSQGYRAIKLDHPDSKTEQAEPSGRANGRQPLQFGSRATLRAAVSRRSLPVFGDLRW